MMVRYIYIPTSCYYAATLPSLYRVPTPPSPADTASVISGCVITILSVTWIAYTSAGSIYRVVDTSESAPSSSSAAYGATGVSAQRNPISGGGSHLSSSSSSSSSPAVGVGSGVGSVPGSEWPAAGGPGATAVTPATYAGEGDSGQAKGGRRHGGSTDSDGEGGHEEPPGNSGSDRVPWMFHLIMALAGLYLAMATTNWGTATR